MLEELSSRPNNINFRIGQLKQIYRTFVRKKKSSHSSAVRFLYCLANFSGAARCLAVSRGYTTELQLKVGERTFGTPCITWIRTLLSFEILRSVHTCVRGSRTPFHKIPRGDFIDDCLLKDSQACVH